MTTNIVQGAAISGYAFDWYPGDPYAPGGRYLPGPQEQINQIECWCAEQFGPLFVYRGEIDGRWTYLNGRFWFRDLTDAIAFKMRWV
ncbi:MAG: hypothetical protein EOP83_10025 [Verrucomicrobiaceae bacterium]|nr:MAG: hypothetical protein EOP83_10025 [Verrucomicrobiaceae bacterium]